MTIIFHIISINNIKVNWDEKHVWDEKHAITCMFVIKIKTIFYSKGRHQVVLLYTMYHSQVDK